MVGLRFSVLSLVLYTLSASGDVITGQPDAAPPGYEQWVSPVVVPAKATAGKGDWAWAVAKARKFVSGLTIEEKVNVTTGVSLSGKCLGNTGEITSRGWKGICLQDGPLGVRLAGNASAFPASTNAATTWDKDLIYKRANALGREFHGKGINVALGPMTNLARVPAAGRNWEGWGADPFLAGVATSETVKGLQDNGVIATAKHFIGNEQEHYRGGSMASQISSSNVDDKTMHEVYLWPFAEAVKAGVAAYMCSYQKINQTQACQNSKLINGILKEELDFQGFIMSDWAAMINGVQPALAGLDMNMPGFKAYGQGEQNEANPAEAKNSWWGASLVEAVKNGSVPEARLDDMVVRTFAAIYKLGQDRGYPPLDLSVNTQYDHAKIIREVGAASNVLLKHEGKVLPLNAKKLTRIGVFGTDSGAPPGGPNCPDRGCDSGGTLAMGWGSGTAEFPYLVDPLAAIKSYIAKKKSSAVVEGVQSDYDYTTIAAVAARSDVCLVFVNADSGEGYINVGGNQGDRNNLTLWHNGETLIKTAADACKNTVVVKHVVGAVIVEDWIDHPNVKAVINAGLPGQESGNALVDVLFGDVNPSGKLTYTVAKRREDYYDDVLYSSPDKTPQITYEEGVNIDYRWFDSKNIEPRFEFGLGLSYTTFKYSGLRSVRTFGYGLWDTAAIVTYNVQNTGDYDGAEVSQLYLGFPEGSGQPPRVLRGFDKSFITKGRSAHVTIKLRQKDISVWDVVSQKWVVPKGKFKVYVGTSSRKINLTGSL
jgi:beta-glucosidase